MHIPKDKAKELIPKVEKIFQDELAKGNPLLCGFCHGHLGSIEEVDWRDTIHLHMTCLSQKCRHEWSVKHLLSNLQLNPDHFKTLNEIKIQREKDREEIARLDALELEELQNFDNIEVIESRDEDFKELDDILFS